MVAEPLFFRTERHGFFTNRTKAVTAKYVFSKESHFLISTYEWIEVPSVFDA